MRIALIYIWYLLLFSLSAFSKDAVLSANIHNLGPKINSAQDEYLPVVYNDTLYFRRNLPGSNDRYTIYRIACNDITCPPIKAPTPIDLYTSSDYSRTELESDGKQNQSPSNATFKDFTSSKLSYLSAPIALEAVNSEFNDMHPALSPDGKVLIFSSDRAGEHNQTDLWVSIRRPNGTWGPPVMKIGDNINTSENEITPFIAKDGSLYYASKGFIRDSVELLFSGKKNNRTKSDINLRNERKNYNIIKAEPVPGQVGNWRNPKLLPYPINTEYNEVGPTLWRDSIIYFSSDRPSGIKPGFGDSFGKYDLYGYCTERRPDCYDTTRAVYLSVIVDNECLKNFSYNGKAYLLASGKILDEFIVPLSGKFRIKLPQPYNRNFGIEIVHPSLNSNLNENIYVANFVDEAINCENCEKPLLPKAPVEKVIKFNIPNSCCPPEKCFLPNLSYFVTGYYRPNTPTNLADLISKFDTKSIKKDVAGSFIADPRTETDDSGASIDYNKLSMDIKKAFKEVTDCIKARCKYAMGKGKRVKVTVVGYADPRSVIGSYPEDDIPGIVKKNQKMNNDILSTLRAYYTQQELSRLLKDIPNLEFDFRGDGVNLIENSLLAKRKVELIIEEK